MPYLTYEGVFELEEVPRRLTVVAVRRLAGGSGDLESVVRVETSTNAGANDVRNLRVFIVSLQRVYRNACAW